MVNMLFATILAAAVVLATGSRASVLPRNKHVADFRIYSSLNCTQDGNLGIWTVIDDDFRPDECKSLNDDSVKSAMVVDMNHGCKINFYTDVACSRVSRGVETDSKRPCLTAAEGLRAWAMRCD